MPFLELAEFRRRLDRYADFHRHELTDGPLVHLAAPPPPEQQERLKRRHAAPIGDPKALVAWWTDPDLYVTRFEETAGLTTHFGDSYPRFFPSLGPGALAAFMGCQSVPQETTIWQKELIDDWDAAPELKLHEDNLYWQAAQALTTESIRRADRRWITEFTDIGGAMDITSYFRGPENLCMDVVTNAGDVRRCEEAVLDAWFEVYDRLYELILADAGGSCGWIGLWYPGRTYPLQCDFSCMISPEMFGDFVMPVLARQAAGLDVATYHLDGPDAVRHLDALCTIPNLRTIQWIPGAGASHRVADWLDLYRRIQDHGRNIWMFCGEEDLDLMFEKLDVDRICITLGCQGVADGERIMGKIERLRAGRKRVQ
jgi:hypothetical protein